MKLKRDNFLHCLPLSKWICGDYWFRVPLLRKLVLFLSLVPAGILRKQNIFRKIIEIDGVFYPLAVKNSADRLFVKKETGKGGVKILDRPLNSSGTYNRTRSALGRKRNIFIAMKNALNRQCRRGLAYLKKESPSFLIPGSPLSKMIKTGLANIYADDERERCFYIENLLHIDDRLDHNGKTAGNRERKKVFTQSGIVRLGKIYSGKMLARPFPESYILHYFPDFAPDEFIRHKARFKIRMKRLFSVDEIQGTALFLTGKIRARDPGSRIQKTVLGMKKISLAAIVAFLAIPLLADVTLGLYGLFRNDYFHSGIYRPGEIMTVRSPYAERANRIYRMNRNTDFSNFRLKGARSGKGMLFRFVNHGDIAVDLSYNSYKDMRISDQNGLTVIAVDREALGKRASDGYRSYRRFLDRVLDKSAMEKLYCFLDDFTGGKYYLFRLTDIGYERVSSDVLKKIMNSPRPLRWIREINGDRPFVTVLYHKADTRKWADLSDIPPLMKKGLILREDRRFYNDLLPLPHRGNDLPVIVPQAAKKIAHDVLELVLLFGNSYDISWIRHNFPPLIDHFRRGFKSDMRGGSSISNQLMELLYTRYIPDINGNGSGYERKIEQKKHELPASALLYWFWDKDDILEAYVNDVFGGYLHGQIIGFRSQAEIYFSRSLDELNLREQMFLAGAVKKPSYIKEYARYLKARELEKLISGDTSRIGTWEEENAIYGVGRHNYKGILKDDTVARWLKNRTDHLLGLLFRHGEIDESDYYNALHNEKIRFDFHPPVYSLDDRLVNNIKREIDQELGEERSDSGLVMNTTVNISMQRSLQRAIDSEARTIYVDGEFRMNGQPSSVQLDGGSRIIWANRRSADGSIYVVNRIVADVGGNSKRKNDWDWVTMANRSLGSSLKPILDLYFLLEGYNLTDRVRNKKLTYANYTLEQQMSYRNYILKYPQRKDEINQIRESWSWTPDNYRGFTGEWITVKEALVYSVNSVHAQIQEIVTPETFAELLNETMNIQDSSMKHTTYRSLILGGSNGDQRYDKFLLAFSLFANEGIITKHTYIDSLLMPRGTEAVPEYKPVSIPVLSRFDRREIEAAVLLINTALRETVRRGSMSAMRGIGAGKTGSSNDLRDALATVHFVSGSDTYIAGIRLGNEKNYSIGRAAHEIATPALSRIVRSLFGEGSILRGDDYDAVLKAALDSHPFIVEADGNYYMKSAEYRPRKLDVDRIVADKRESFLVAANDYFARQEYAAAARLYENYLMLTSHFDSDNPVFRNMIVCYIRLNNIERVSRLIMHFTPPAKMRLIADIYERLYGIEINLDKKLTEQFKKFMGHAMTAKQFLDRRTTDELRLFDEYEGEGKKTGNDESRDDRKADPQLVPREKEDGTGPDMHVDKSESMKIAMPAIGREGNIDAAKNASPGKIHTAVSAEK
ncbi:MAG: hypothetical protein CVV44_13900 [Spirochaetae bacterium HGW-Spirochaetae-1]|jgi:membrane peptidoglycan carboxypeptidase|nr:MAG: hypothetical protein CVV44_13900 [Spirochaetae bacterium HGW-Spirochaetae-1]